GSVLYAGSDGGVYSSSNFTSANSGAVLWNNLNATLAITEFATNISIHPSDPRIAYAGTQDNGTQMYRGNLAWEQVAGGDGGMTAIDPAIPSIWYGATTSANFYKFSGLTSIAAPFNAVFTDRYPILNNGIDLSDRIIFYPQLVMNPSNPLWLYFGSHRLYQSYDGEGTWNLLSP